MAEGKDESKNVVSNKDIYPAIDKAVKAHQERMNQILTNNRAWIQDVVDRASLDERPDDVVGTAVTPDVVGGAAIMVDPYNVEAIAQAICSVVGDQSLRRDLRQRGLARAAQFTWERTVEKTAQL